MQTSRPTKHHSKWLTFCIVDTCFSSYEKLMIQRRRVINCKREARGVVLSYKEYRIALERLSVTKDRYENVTSFMYRTHLGLGMFLLF